MRQSIYDVILVFFSEAFLSLFHKLFFFLSADTFGKLTMDSVILHRKTENM
jgi:hypothetical protein